MQAVDEEKGAGIEEKRAGNGETFGADETVECVGILVHRAFHLQVAEHVGEVVCGEKGKQGKQEGRNGETDSAEKRRRERLEAEAANWTPGSTKSDRTMSGLFLEWKKQKENTGKCRNSPPRIMQQGIACRSVGEVPRHSILRRCDFYSNR